jgi:ABC-type cobalt transport system substrate-binding protein
MPSSSNDRITLVDEMKQEEGNRWGCILIIIIICCVVLPITINTDPTTQNNPIHNKQKHPTSQPSSQPSFQPSFQPSSQPSFQPSLQPSFQPTNSSIVQTIIDFVFNNNTYLRYN